MLCGGGEQGLREVNQEEIDALNRLWSLQRRIERAIIAGHEAIELQELRVKAITTRQHYVNRIMEEPQRPTIAGFVIVGATTSQLDSPFSPLLDIVGAGIVAYGVVVCYIIGPEDYAAEINAAAASIEAGINAYFIAREAEDAARESIRTGAGRSDKHGREPGDELKRQLEELARKLKEAVKRKDKVRIRNKIDRINKELGRIRKGVEHSRRYKGPSRR